MLRSVRTVVSFRVNSQYMGSVRTVVSFRVNSQCRGLSGRMGHLELQTSFQVC